jgi:hypothetical protein
MWHPSATEPRVLGGHAAGARRLRTVLRPMQFDVVGGGAHAVYDDAAFRARPLHRLVLTHRPQLRARVVV